MGNCCTLLPPRSGENVRTYRIRPDMETSTHEENNIRLRKINSSFQNHRTGNNQNEERASEESDRPDEANMEAGHDSSDNVDRITAHGDVPAQLEDDLSDEERRSSSVSNMSEMSWASGIHKLRPLESKTDSLKVEGGSRLVLVSESFSGESDLRKRYPATRSSSEYQHRQRNKSSNYRNNTLRKEETMTCTFPDSYEASIHRRSGSGGNINFHKPRDTRQEEIFWIPGSLARHIGYQPDQAFMERLINGKSEVPSIRVTDPTGQGGFLEAKTYLEEGQRDEILAIYDRPRSLTVMTSSNCESEERSISSARTSCSYDRSCDLGDFVQEKERAEGGKPSPTKRKQSVFKATINDGFESDSQAKPSRQQRASSGGALNPRPKEARSKSERSQKTSKQATGARFTELTTSFHKASSTPRFSPPNQPVANCAELKADDGFHVEVSKICVQPRRVSFQEGDTDNVRAETQEHDSGRKDNNGNFQFDEPAKPSPSKLNLNKKMIINYETGDNYAYQFVTAGHFSAKNSFQGLDGKGGQEPILSFQDTPMEGQTHIQILSPVASPRGQVERIVVVPVNKVDVTSLKSSRSLDLPDLVEETVTGKGTKREDVNGNPCIINNHFNNNLKSLPELRDKQQQWKTDNLSNEQREYLFQISPNWTPSRGSPIETPTRGSPSHTSPMKESSSRNSPARTPFKVSPSNLLHPTVDEEDQKRNSFHMYVSEPQDNNNVEMTKI